MSKLIIETVTTVTQLHEEGKTATEISRHRETYTVDVPDARPAPSGERRPVGF